MQQRLLQKSRQEFLAEFAIDTWHDFAQLLHKPCWRTFTALTYVSSLYEDHHFVLTKRHKRSPTHIQERHPSFHQYQMAVSRSTLKEKSKKRPENLLIVSAVAFNAQSVVLVRI